MDPASEDMVLSIVLETELMEISADSSLKLQLTQADLASFSIPAAGQYPSLSKRAITFLLPFTTTYSCEAGFSIVTVTKSMARNKLIATLYAPLLVSLSRIPPQPDLIISQKQAPSVSLRVSRLFILVITADHSIMHIYSVFFVVRIRAVFSLRNGLTIKSGPKG